MRKFFALLTRPSVSIPVYALLLIGLLIGTAGAVGFHATLEATSTEAFCTSCHQMAEGPFAMLKETTHFSNESGVTPTCADCHVPKEFGPKLWRKVQSVREVWSSINGKIDTPEKYLDHVAEMKAREIARLRANDSQECRNCHDVTRMQLALQSKRAQGSHRMLIERGTMTCIDCHQGIAHMSPEVAERLKQVRVSSKNPR